MTSFPPPAFERASRRRPKRNRPSRGAALTVAGIVVFAVGIALGEALHDNPRPAPAQTHVRTLPPPGTASTAGAVTG